MAVSPILRRHALPLLALLGIDILVLWPFGLTGRAMGHSLSDLSDHYWGSWWWGGEWLAGRVPLHTFANQIPDGTPLWHVDPVGAFWCLLLRPLGYPVAWNGMILLTVILASVALYGVAWRRTEHRGGAFAAGVSLVCSPYLLGLLHSGLTEYAGLVFPVLFIGLLLEAVEGRPRAWILAGLALAACTLQAFYYGAFAVLLALCALAGSDWRSRLRGVAGTLAAGLTLSAPLLWFAGRTVFGADGVVGEETAPGWKQATLPALDLSLFFKPGRHYFPDTPAMGNPGILQIHYLGWLLLGIGVWGFWTWPALRRHRAMLVLYAVACAGPALAWNGSPVMLGGGPFPLPLAAFYRMPGSPWEFIHHPYRLVAFLVPLLALGLAAALHRMPWWAPAGLALGLFVEGAALSSAPWPIPSTPVAPPALQAAIPGDGGLLDWPPDGSDWNRRYLMWQVEHGRPVPYGVNTFLPLRYLADPMVSDLLARLDDTRTRTRNRDVETSVRIPIYTPAASHLGDLGVRWFALHTDALKEAEGRRTEDAVRAWLGEPVSDGVWAIPAGAFGPPVIPPVIPSEAASPARELPSR